MYSKISFVTTRLNVRVCHWNGVTSLHQSFPWFGFAMLFRPSSLVSRLASLNLISYQVCCALLVYSPIGFYFHCLELVGVAWHCSCVGLQCFCFWLIAIIYLLIPFNMILWWHLWCLPQSAKQKCLVIWYLTPQLQQLTLFLTPIIYLGMLPFSYTSMTRNYTSKYHDNPLLYSYCWSGHMTVNCCFLLSIVAVIFVKVNHYSKRNLKAHLRHESHRFSSFWRLRYYHTTHQLYQGTWSILVPYWI